MTSTRFYSRITRTRFGICRAHKDELEEQERQHHDHYVRVTRAHTKQLLQLTRQREDEFNDNDERLTQKQPDNIDKVACNLVFERHAIDRNDPEFDSDDELAPSFARKPKETPE